MLTKIQDRQTIFSSAIEIASAEERDAYIARSCGHDVTLRRLVEELVAAHFEAGSPEKPARAAVNGTALPRQDLAQAGANHADVPKGPNVPSLTEEPVETCKLPPKQRRGLTTMGAVLLLLLLAAAVGSTSLAVWALRAEKQARTAAQQAGDERDQARKAEEEAKQQRDQALAARQIMAEECDQALAAEKAARRAENVTKTVLAFVQNNVLSATHSMGWGSGEAIKDVSLRKAVDAAESKVAERFADQPLVEASIREILGSTYLDLGEAALAVKQCERALALREALLGPDHSDTGDSRNKLAVAYRLAGRTAEASRLYDQNLHSVSHASALAIRAAMLLAQKEPVEAELKLRECLAIRQELKPDDWTTFAAKALLGEALLEQKKYADAEPLLRSGYEGMKKREAKIPDRDKVRLAKALERLTQLYEVWGKKDEAARWRKELDTSAGTMKKF